jgi:hypothetical protein
LVDAIYAEAMLYTRVRRRFLLETLIEPASGPTVVQREVSTVVEVIFY